MTTYLFHGDDNASSRNNLFEQKKKHVDIRELNGDKLLPKDLASTLGTESLFGNETLLIENLFSRPRSKDKDACVQLLINYSGNRDILIWEKKTLTKLTTNKLPKTWIVKESKPPALLYNFLDTIVPGNYQQATKILVTLRKNTDDGLTYIMLSRHISTLIQAKTATNLKLPPWQIGKLKRQASSWEISQLLFFYDELYKIDKKIKTGTTKLDLGSQLDILLLQVLG
ncbi:MAG: hypothetical protein DPW11_03540 [bacterium]|nr:hypothetical protein [Candidatus Microgenomates bacterium CPR3]MCQ3944823.1 hypothetical protein [bacterium]RIK51487.1 MAG: hypothetical protein DCC61_02545 [Candidatus Microgenomates bacterium]